MPRQNVRQYIFLGRNRFCIARALQMVCAHRPSAGFRFGFRALYRLVSAEYWRVFRSARALFYCQILQRFDFFEERLTFLSVFSDYFAPLQPYWQYARLDWPCRPYLPISARRRFYRPYLSVFVRRRFYRRHTVYCCRRTISLTASFPDPGTALAALSVSGESAVLLFFAYERDFSNSEQISLNWSPKAVIDTILALTSNTITTRRAFFTNPKRSKWLFSVGGICDTCS